MGDEWGADEPIAAQAEQYAVVAAPEIKLFGKWSTDDVQVSDISLTVSMFCCSSTVEKLYESL